MARRRRHLALTVYLNGRRVGLLRREPDGAVDFIYDQAWLDARGAMPVSLSLPLREDRYIGAPVAAVFDNLLPDNETIRGRIAAQVGADGAAPYSLLAALGRDCVRALQFLPDDAPPPAVGAIDRVPIGPDHGTLMISASGQSARRPARCRAGPAAPGSCNSSRGRS